MRKFVLGFTIFALLCSVASCGLTVFVNTRTVHIDDDVTLVTLDALPDDVLVLKRAPDPVIRVQHLVRPKPVPPAAPGKPAPAESAALPYACGTIKYYNAHFSVEQLEAMRVEAHQPKPSAAQLRAIEACLHS